MALRLTIEVTLEEDLETAGEGRGRRGSGTGRAVEEGSSTQSGIPEGLCTLCGPVPPRKCPTRRVN